MANICISRNSASAFGALEYPKHCFGRTATYNLRDAQMLQQVHDIARTMSLQSSTADGALGSVRAESTLISESPKRPEHKDGPATSDSSRSKVDGKGVELPDHAGSDVQDSRYNVDMDAIVKRMQDSVMIKDMPVKSSRWIQVPKGYLVDLEVRPAGHYRARADIKTQVNKRKREATLPETSQRGWREEIQGFRPEEILWNGAIGYKHCEPEPSSLTNEIHPLFDRSCFDDTPDAIYDQLIPGLQLATRFLTQPICMKFWVTLAMGKRRHDPEMSALNGRPAQRIDKHVELTEERARTLIELIKKVGKDKLVHFRFHSLLQTVNNSKEDGYAYAISAPICDYKGIDTEYHGTNRSLVRSIIRFHADYYIVAKKLSQLKFPDMSQKLRFSFGFAVLIVHELAHSIEGIHFRGRASQWVDFQQSGYYREPYWLDWSESECGRAWEQTMFGGHLQPTNGRVDGSHGIAVADWPFGESANKPSPKSHRWWTVSMDYICWIFKKETWEQRFDLNDWHVFNIPRDGATSLCINSFTTMNPSEEWRVAKEEAAALVALSNAEPAKKKRVKALGDIEDKRPEVAEVVAKAVVEGEQKTREIRLKRQVPIFPATRRLSSIMPGPLPDDTTFSSSPRAILTPYTRHSSSPTSTLSQSVPKPTSPRFHEGYIPRPQTSLPIKRREGSNQKVVQENPLTSRPDDGPTNTELLSEYGARSLGFLERWKQRSRRQREGRSA